MPNQIFREEKEFVDKLAALDSKACLKCAAESVGKSIEEMDDFVRKNGRLLAPDILKEIEKNREATDHSHVEALMGAL